MYHFADYRQQWDFPHDHFAPRAGNANMQLARVVLNLDLLRIVAEIAQPVQVILTEEGQP
ncbi:Uncharacterised protein [Serratia quinivorans]|nr:Uncharacterised protein [Serratia quinivorans]